MHGYELPNSDPNIAPEVRPYSEEDCKTNLHWHSSLSRFTSGFRLAAWKKTCQGILGLLQSYWCYWRLGVPTKRFMICTLKHDKNQPSTKWLFLGNFPASEVEGPGEAGFSVLRLKDIARQRELFSSLESFSDESNGTSDELDTSDTLDQSGRYRWHYSFNLSLYLSFSKHAEKPELGGGNLRKQSALKQRLPWRPLGGKYVIRFGTGFNYFYSGQHLQHPISKSTSRRKPEDSIS